MFIEICSEVMIFSDLCSSIPDYKLWFSLCKPYLGARQPRIGAISWVQHFFLPSFLIRGHHCEEYIFTDILGYKYITNYINMLRIKLEYLLLFLFLIRLAPGFSFTPSQILSFHLLRILSLWSLQYTYCELFLSSLFRFIYL